MPNFVFCSCKPLHYRFFEIITITCMYVLQPIRKHDSIRTSISDEAFPVSPIQTRSHAFVLLPCQTVQFQRLRMAQI